MRITAQFQQFLYIPTALTFVKDISAIALNVIFKTTDYKKMTNLIYRRCSSVNECSNRLNALSNAAYLMMGFSVIAFGVMFYENLRKEYGKIKLTNNQYIEITKEIGKLQIEINKKNRLMDLLKEEIARTVIVLKKERELRGPYLTEMDQEQFDKLQAEYKEIQQSESGKKSKFFDKDDKIEALEEEVSELQEEAKDLNEEEALLKQIIGEMKYEITELKEKLNMILISDEDMASFYEFQKKLLGLNEMYELQALDSREVERMRALQTVFEDMKKLQNENAKLQHKLDQLQTLFRKKSAE
ncbi:MAG: hypothetical protein K1060chlam5_00620 [Candidatus Anoxychlamydiales bacterium]|nr:hypothetical protein [Candidatus Anoxychlamydiales bacterium]